MASTTGIPQPHLGAPAKDPTLQVDFTWKKFKAVVSDCNKPDDPLYIVSYQTIKPPHVIFKSTKDDREIGTGTLHPISINARFRCHGQKGQLKALKRFQTRYTHLSHAYSDDDKPVPMTWTSGASFKSWDFVCNDENMNPVAKFSASCWSLTKVGRIEFLGPKATSREAQEEILVTGLTLFYCMLLRTSSILSLFGACIARPGPIKQTPAIKSQKEIEFEQDHEDVPAPPYEAPASASGIRA